MLSHNKKSKMSKPIPVRFPAPLLEDIKSVARSGNITIQEAIRLATLKGLQQLSDFLGKENQTSDSNRQEGAKK